MFKRQETIFASDIVTHKYSKANNVGAHPSHALSLTGTALNLLLPRGRGYLGKFAGKFFPIPRVMELTRYPVWSDKCGVDMRKQRDC